jgi:hypothetical protein
MYQGGELMHCKEAFKSVYMSKDTFTLRVITYDIYDSFSITGSTATSRIFATETASGIRGAGSVFRFCICASLCRE